MKITRRYRRTRRRVRWALVVGTLGLALFLGGCGSQDGKILETETGRNGVKVEVQSGAGDYEAYLVPDTICAEGEYIHECADADDYLAPRAGHRPGVNR